MPLDGKPFAIAGYAPFYETSLYHEYPGKTVGEIRSMLMKNPTFPPGKKYIDWKDDGKEKIGPCPPDLERRQLR